MATSQTSPVFQHLRRAVLLRDGAGLTDGQLLADYMNRRDEAALAALVRRHGPMVWGVCRRILRNQHDVEDAFQATFLVLVRKAASIASPELLANWLYGVAHQTAIKARATTAKRSTRERQVTQMPEPTVTEPDLWNDLQPLLDQELSRLPDAYRAILVLCDLEGKTRKEVARQLGVPEGTVGSRLARGRTMLAKRLARHGLTVSGGALAALLSQDAASACVPPSVVSSTIKAASLFAAGQAAGVISVKVAALTGGVLKAMFTTKLRSVMAVLVVLACVGGGTMALFSADEPQPGRVKEVKPDLSRDAEGFDYGDSRGKRGRVKKVKPDLSRATFPNIEVKKTDLQELQGTWTLVTQELEGKAIDREDSPLYQLRFTDKELSQWYKRGKKNDSSRMLQLDAGKKQKEIDVVWGIIAWTGIYKLDGDKLTLCVRYAGGGWRRPTDFTTKPGSQTLLLVYKKDGKLDFGVTPGHGFRYEEDRNEFLVPFSEQKVLTPEEAIKQRQEKVTVRFKVTSTQTFQISKSNVVGKSAGSSGEGCILNGGDSFYVQLFPPVMESMKRLGIEPDKHFKGKVVQVTGLLQAGPSPSQFQIVVNDLTHIEVVKE